MKVTYRCMLFPLASIYFKGHRVLITIIDHISANVEKNYCSAHINGINAQELKSTHFCSTLNVYIAMIRHAIGNVSCIIAV